MWRALGLGIAIVSYGTACKGKSARKHHDAVPRAAAADATPTAPEIELTPVDALWTTPVDGVRAFVVIEPDGSLRGGPFTGAPDLATLAGADIRDDASIRDALGLEAAPAPDELTVVGYETDADRAAAGHAAVARGASPRDPARFDLLIAADRRAPARRLVEVLDATDAGGARLAVGRGAQFATLDLWFRGAARIVPAPDVPMVSSWLELSPDQLIRRAGDGGVILQISGGTPPEEDDDIVDNIRGDAHTVTLDGDPTVDQLVRTIAAARAAGASEITLWDWPRTPRSLHLGVPRISLPEDIDGDAVRAAVDARRDALLACQGSGKVTVELEIDERGQPGDVQARGAGSECIAEVFRTTRYPAARKGWTVDIWYELAFDGP